MRVFRMTLFSCFWAAAGLAQLTLEQKEADFRHLAGLYAKQYAPYEWKRDTQGFDLLQIGPWLERIRATRSDLDFYEVMVDYVASLNDAHAVYTLPSNFVARLNFTADVYDGKVLVDSINRVRLPATEFPFRAGYEVVAVDGMTAEELLRALRKYSTAANPLSTRRLAASFITVRPQAFIPYAVDVGDSARVVMRRPDGALETHIIPWTKTGLALRNAGPVPAPFSEKPAARTAEGEEPDYMAPLRELQRCQIGQREVLGFGARTPIFELPANFRQRLGRAAGDFFYSGTFEAEGHRIGFIRIPDYSPSNFESALTQFRAEIAFFGANTDGLIVDEMRNPGGFVSYVNALLQQLIPYRFRTLGFEIRATSDWVARISSALESARAQGAPDWVIALLSTIKSDITTANSELRGRTGALPLDDVTLDREPQKDDRGQVTAYSKPLMVLVDEMSASGGDAFPATIQDNGRGILFGMRTMGAGGSVAGLTAGTYSEGSTTLTQTLMNRKEPAAVPDYPVAPYVENIGVHPEIVADYMTRENLLENGRPFVTAFTAAMVEHIRRSR